MALKGPSSPAIGYRTGVGVCLYYLYKYCLGCKEEQDSSNIEDLGRGRAFSEHIRSMLDD